ncbi:MAG: serine/threonine-protein kinase [Patescibacteria group bacterium]
MKEKRIEFVYPYSDPETVSPGKAFGEKEFITHDEIKKISADISAGIEVALAQRGITEESISIVLDVLDRDEILKEIQRAGKFRVRKVSSDGVDQWKIVTEDKAKRQEFTFLTESEIEMALSPIRAAILDELQQKFGEHSIHLITEALNHSVHKLHGERILKNVRSMGGHRDPEGKHARNKALARLFSISDHSPYILYHVQEVDNSNSGDAFEIQNKESFKTLEELVISAENQISRKQALQLFTDAVRGVQFLEEHGLVLTDLHECNIAVDEKDRTGKLYDFDGLRISGVPTTYYARLFYAPPEARQSHIRGITTAQSVYELGKTLDWILGHYDFENSEPSMKMIIDLCISMTSKTEAQRPNTATIIQTLESAIAMME